MWHDQRIRLYRDPAHGVAAGVCAGIADYLGVERIAVRIACVIALFLFFPPTVIAYVVLAIALPKRPPALYASGEDEAFWRSMATRPDDTLHGLARRFAALETRLRAMEQQVTASEFDLHRKFRDLR
jgi:phage shock protein C